MTTILYHQGVLLADSRASRKPPGATGSEDMHRCVHCGEKAHTARDNSNKIKLPFKKRTFRGETIRVMSGAGAVESLATQLSAWVSLDDYEKTYSEVYKIMGIGSGRHNIDCTVMLVTDKHVYVIDYYKSDARGLHVDIYNLDQTVAIGSGQQAAKTAILAYGADAFEAMRVASVVDKSTGGPIRYVDLNDAVQSLEVRTYEPQASPCLLSMPASRRAAKPKAPAKAVGLEGKLKTAVNDLSKTIK